jgi:hypothetical protein
MLHAVAVRTKVTHLIMISVNGKTPLMGDEIDAFKVILTRIAFESRGASSSIQFDGFLDRFTEFSAVKGWLYRKNVVLIIDELNLIRPTRDRYANMSYMLDQIVSR